MVAVSALAMAGLIFVWTKPAFAEFEIQESEVEKGEAEFEYRGAVHSGFPKAEREEAEEDGDEEGALEEEEEGEFLLQSHDFEIQYGITDRIMLSTTLGTAGWQFRPELSRNGTPVRDRRAQR